MIPDWIKMAKTPELLVGLKVRVKAVTHGGKTRLVMGPVIPDDVSEVTDEGVGTDQGT